MQLAIDTVSNVILASNYTALVDLAEAMHVNPAQLFTLKAWKENALVANRIIHIAEAAAIAKRSNKAKRDAAAAAKEATDAAAKAAKEAADAMSGAAHTEDEKDEKDAKDAKKKKVRYTTPPL